MNKLKESLELAKVNTIYWNLNAVYDYCGDDPIEFAKLSPDMKSAAHEILSKYVRSPIFRPLFFHLNERWYFYNTNHDKHQYEEPSLSVLELSNREIFISALKHFFGEDIIFLNMDAIYDEAENIFSKMIEPIKNNACVIKRTEKYFGDEYYTSNIYQNLKRIVVIPGPGNRCLMYYVRMWCTFMLAKMRSINMIFWCEMCYLRIEASPWRTHWHNDLCGSN